MMKLFKLLVITVIVAVLALIAEARHHHRHHHHAPAHRPAPVHHAPAPTARHPQPHQPHRPHQPHQPHQPHHPHHLHHHGHKHHPHGHAPAHVAPVARAPVAYTAPVSYNAPAPVAYTAPVSYNAPAPVAAAAPAVQVPPVKPSTTAVSELKAAILAGDAHAEKKALEKVAGSVQEKTTTAVVAAENQQPAPMPVYKNQYTWLKEKVEEMQRKIKEHAELLKEKDLRNRHHRHHHRRPNHFEDDELPSVEEAKHRVQRAERKVRSLKEESARKNARKTERTSRFKMDRVGRRFKSTATATVDDGSSSAAIPLYAKDNSWSAWGWSWLGYPSSVKLDGSDDLLKKYLETRDAQVKKDKNGKLYVEVTDK